MPLAAVTSRSQVPLLDFMSVALQVPLLDFMSVALQVPLLDFMSVAYRVVGFIPSVLPLIVVGLYVCLSTQVVP
ncbi:MAG: hypothetical protein NXY57DRAFT_969805 [Lentinula lateritia]|nr:MAG: hypothetical protein NXY57DRAFT_969805 [Lentinula lateritia]